ncbi:EutN/CcmL family microcompartment protein [Vibrio salinus]|uniref:EutN/CcmL family microcompartment protein n=1 Tax=Vibrio salinus TaxID=2899784 RepID=UPI001E4BB0E2|nr:EutN/CcmL family microcompartment protein [Vibrio salinus]MCE0495496.1 EutN/CcmL family microcompartment protein [Vibrio salinus]
MYLAKVTGAIVSTTKHASLIGTKLLIVARLDEHNQVMGNPQIAVDCVGAGNGEIVVVSTGSSARQSRDAEDSVVDAAIVGIVDSLEVNGR